MTNTNNPVDSRTQLLQELHATVTEADNGKPPTLEKAIELYRKVHEEVYIQASSPGIKVPVFWSTAFVLVGRLVLEANWDNIQKWIVDRRSKESGNVSNETENNQTNQTKPNNPTT